MTSHMSLGKQGCQGNQACTLLTQTHQNNSSDGGTYRGSLAFQCHDRMLTLWQKASRWSQAVACQVVTAAEPCVVMQGCSCSFKWHPVPDSQSAGSCYRQETAIPPPLSEGQQLISVTASCKHQMMCRKLSTLHVPIITIRNVDDDLMHIPNFERASSNRHLYKKQPGRVIVSPGFLLVVSTMHPAAAVCSSVIDGYSGSGGTQPA